LLEATLSPIDPAVRWYLRGGKRARVDEGYKCRARRSWYAVPLPRRVPDAFLPYMTGDVPRLIVNERRRWSTNLLHGVSFTRQGTIPAAVSAAMLSSITALSAEVEGRAYGGGVLKLETKESERLLVPKLSADGSRVLVRLHPVLDQLLRDRQYEMASEVVDAVLGVDREPLVAARMAYRTRRRDRGAKQSSA
jgi:adenine-specific DNA-methyltransferase